MRRTETQLVRACLDLLRARGAVAVRVNQLPLTDAKGRRFFTGTAGVSDIIACYRDVALAVECKVGRNDVTDAQDAFLLAWAQAGGVSLIVRETVDGLNDLLGRLDAQAKAPSAATGPGRAG